MATETPFSQRIVTTYRNARYGSESGENIVSKACWLSWVFPKKIVRRMVTFLLAAGLALGAGCSEDHSNFGGHYIASDLPGVPVGDIGYEPPIMCLENEAYCNPLDGMLDWCDEGESKSESCTEFCYNQYGLDYYAKGCNFVAENNHCTCTKITCSEDRSLTCDTDYNLRKCIDGELQAFSCTDECPFFEDEQLVTGLVDAYCKPGEGLCTCLYSTFDSESLPCAPEDSRCVDDAIWLECENQRYVPMDCDDYCRNTYGEHYYATGCDDNAVEPCQCEYGLTDGIQSECQPGEGYCPDGEFLATCESEDIHTLVDCQTLCREEYGANSVSERGCEAYKNQENPCGCTTRASSPTQNSSDCLLHDCEPGKTYCVDDRIVVCQSESRQTVTTCSVYCPTTYGEDSEALDVCDDLAPDNPCHCTHTERLEMPPILPRPPSLFDDE